MRQVDDIAAFGDVAVRRIAAVAEDIEMFTPEVATVIVHPSPEKEMIPPMPNVPDLFLLSFDLAQGCGVCKRATVADCLSCGNNRN